MGRFGGRGGIRHGRGHNSVEFCHSITVWGYFQRALMGLPDETFEAGYFIDGDTAHLLYCQRGERRTATIELTLTPCGYGGHRKWFLCPRCSRRVGKLYLPNGIHPSRWYCRHCHDLTYVQRQERAMRYWTYNGRALRVAERWLDIREGDKWIHKPKRQRWTTYQKRAKQYKELSSQANLESMIGLMGVSLFRRHMPEAADFIARAKAAR